MRNICRFPDYCDTLIVNLLLFNTKLVAAEIDVTNKDEISQQKQEFNFVLPIEMGRITARFGNMKNSFARKIVHHDGIDIAAPKGTEVYAAADGKVLSAKYDKGAGINILLQHEHGYQTFYSHLDTMIVKVGELITKVGNTGLSTGPHVHFEIRLNNEPKDPQKYIHFERLKNYGLPILITERAMTIV